MPALNMNEKLKCEYCGKAYRRSDAARHRKSWVREVISPPEYLFHLQPARNEIPYEQEARKVNPEVNKVCMV